jgi:hypothetical protein
MTAVFILYGESTKRSDDLQTGGYGIGCKTGFGYSDSFLVNTYKNGVARNYSCYLDETKCGELVLLGEVPTTEPDGTEIVIPVKTEDINRFKEETAKATEFWEVRPEIVGGKIPYRNLESAATLKGKDWFISPNGASTTIRLIIDGIEYPYTGKVEIPFRLNYNSSIYLKFPTGMIPVAVNREQIEVDDKTPQLLKQRLLEIKSELLASFKTAIDSCEDYITACMKLEDCCRSIGTDAPSDYLWNGKKILPTRPRVQASMMLYHRPNGRTRNLRKTSYTSLFLNHDTVFVETTRAFDTVCEAGALAIFNAFPKAQTIQMVRWDHDAKKEDFSELEFVQFDDYYTPKVRKPSLSRLTFYKFIPYQNEFRRTSSEEFEKDENKKLWCRITKKGGGYFSSNLPSNNLVLKYGGSSPWNYNGGITNILKFIGENVSLYAFADTLPDERVHEAMEDVEKLEDAVENAAKKQGVDYGELVYTKYADFTKYFFFYEDFERSLYNNRDSLVDTSEFKQYLELSEALRNKIDKLSFLDMLTKVFDEIPSKAFGAEVAETAEKMKIKYPMLKPFSVKSGVSCSELPTPVALDYIRLIDSQDAIKP